MALLLVHTTIYHIPMWHDMAGDCVFARIFQFTIFVLNIECGLCVCVPRCLRGIYSGIKLFSLEKNI